MALADTSTHADMAAQRYYPPPKIEDEIEEAANRPSTSRIGEKASTLTPSKIANPPPKPFPTNTTPITQDLGTPATGPYSRTISSGSHPSPSTTQTTPCPSPRHGHPPNVHPQSNSSPTPKATQAATQAAIQAKPQDRPSPREIYILYGCTPPYPPPHPNTHGTWYFTLAPCVQCLLSRHPRTHAACIAHRQRHAACRACERSGMGKECVGLRRTTEWEEWEDEALSGRERWGKRQGRELVKGFVPMRMTDDTDESWARKRQVWRGLETEVERRRDGDYAPRGLESVGFGKGGGREGVDEVMVRRERDRGLLRGGVGAAGKMCWLREWGEEKEKDHDGDAEDGGDDGEEDGKRVSLDELGAAVSLLRSKTWRFSRTYWVEVGGCGGGGGGGGGGESKWERRERSEKEQMDWVAGLEIGKALEEARVLLMGTARWRGQAAAGRDWRTRIMRK
ncbi:hypothetical protein K490DRAFT_66147 [Saccharata proteae CBS 121410]|uniref:Uncharacterized protein n=1 Tax=Saccharata proteae CBS 121410 TaxID=1314787 RepID=A0A9P4LWR9_9PEZI|nr:hypothetical protein K490DRAFT_66147 [Saccharata proteae CBS 121410]